MAQSEHVIIQEGESVECSSGKHVLFEPSETVTIGFGGYSTVYKVVILAGHFRHKTESNSPNTLNQVSSHRSCIHLWHS
jgi:archaellum component FlaF (FlaF/FlaG flagellin family)